MKRIFIHPNCLINICQRISVIIRKTVHSLLIHINLQIDKISCKNVYANFIFFNLHNYFGSLFFVQKLFCLSHWYPLLTIHFMCKFYIFFLITFHQKNIIKKILKDIIILLNLLIYFRVNFIFFLLLLNISSDFRMYRPSVRSLYVLHFCTHPLCWTII